MSNSLALFYQLRDSITISPGSSDAQCPYCALESGLNLSRVFFGYCCKSSQVHFNLNSMKKKKSWRSDWISFCLSSQFIIGLMLSSSLDLRIDSWELKSTIRPLESPWFGESGLLLDKNFNEWKGHLKKEDATVINFTPSSSGTWKGDWGRKKLFRYLRQINWCRMIVT